MIFHVISSPRNISTAFMYSFAQRSDTSVVDEPFYANYLMNSKADHPGRELILSNMERDFQRILDKLHPIESEHLFIKNMAHHLSGRNLNFILNWKNIILIRDPKQLIASFAKVIPQPDMSDIGVRMQYDIFHFIQNQNQTCIVLDSGELLKNPKYVLAQLCDQLDIPFEEGMLSWDKGGSKEDGVWAKHWYKNVHESTGFGVQKTSSQPLPPECEVLYQEALPLYQELFKHAIKAQNAPEIQS